MFLLQRSVPSQCSASDDVDFLTGETLLGFNFIAELCGERGDDVVEEEDDLMLVAEDAFSFFLDDICMGRGLHLNLRRLMWVNVFFLRSKSV